MSRHDPDVCRARLVEQRERGVERRDEARRVALGRVDGLEPEPDARVGRRRCRAAQAVDDDRAALGRRSARRAGR